ncbi:2-amino-5-chloromuconic acid deaminase [Oligella sp. MSHR50489EDL]|uniref:amidase n=1 Tax=Oligella sp. MSHR50489EDL TaxID=3139409 RepID=UPI003D81BAE1
MLLKDLTIKEIARQLRNGDVTATSLVESCQIAYEQTESKLNAYKTWSGDNAKHVASSIDSLISAGYDFGPLMGIPVSVKDLFAVPKMPTFAGSKRDLGPRWQVPGTLINSLTKQGATIIGKTHTVEFAFGGVGINEHWGTPRNPWDSKEHRIPGGSSSGAGVSLCQGTALLALGTDTAGSVRIPASFTGTVGLKTTIGLWPRDQVVPLSKTLDTPGLLARSVEDVAFAFDAIENSLRGNSKKVNKLHSLGGLRVGVPEHFFWDDIESDIADVVHQAMRSLEADGAILVPIKIPNCAEVYKVFQMGGLGAPELSSFLKMELPEAIDHLGSLVKVRIEGSEILSSLEYLSRKSLIERSAASAKLVFESVDIWLHPTLVNTAAIVDEVVDIEAYRKVNMLVLRNTSIANLMDLCALSLPVGLDVHGIPIGLQLTAGALQERKLLAIALRVEEIIGKAKEILGNLPK